MIPYGRQSIDEEDINAVIQVLKSDWLTCGPKVSEFEDALAQECGAKFAIAVSNGTAALHIAALAAGLSNGDRAITSAISFLASANCIEYTGASTAFADIDPSTANISLESIKETWSENTKAVVAVDFAGQPCNLPEIGDFVKSKGGIIIEDAAHSIGASFEHMGKSYRVGGHPWADMTTFSFHPVKTITCGEGGAILTNNPVLADKCRLIRSHGMHKSTAEFKGLGNPELNEFGLWYYEMEEPGFNYRLTDIQCALGLSQMKKLTHFINRRRELAALYHSLFEKVANITPLKELGCNRSAYHLYPVLIDFEETGLTRSAVITKLGKIGIGSQVHYIPIPLQPYYRNKYGFCADQFPEALKYYKRCLSLPLFPSLTDKEAVFIAESLQRIIAP